MTITWNIVTENMAWSKALEEKFRPKLTKLERHLNHFPPDAVHLLISLERTRKKSWYTAALTLRVPHNILRAAKSARDPLPAFDNAVKALLRELAGLKARLRREPEWKRKERRHQLHAAKLAAFAPEPMAAGTGPQNWRDVIAASLEQEDAALLRHVRRLIRQDELSGDLPAGAMDARAVANEVARQALAAPQKKPVGINSRLWFYVLARQELARRRKALNTQAAETVPLDAAQVLPDDLEIAEGYDAEQPLDIIERELEPPVVETKDLLPDPRVAPPDVALARQELQEHVRTAAQLWPEAEREIFELYFVEGFEPVEIVLLTKRTPREIEMLIGAVQTRLRWELADETPSG